MFNKVLVYTLQSMHYIHSLCIIYTVYALYTVYAFQMRASGLYGLSFDWWCHLFVYHWVYRRIFFCVWEFYNDQRRASRHHGDTINPPLNIMTIMWWSWCSRGLRTLNITIYLFLGFVWCSLEGGLRAGALIMDYGGRRTKSDWLVKNRDNCCLFLVRAANFSTDKKTQHARWNESIMRKSK